MLFLIFQPSEKIWVNFFLAALFIQLRLICNLLDGLVAVEGGLKTPTGGLYNEVPDRVCDSFTFIGLGYCCHHLWLGVELGYMATVLAVSTAYIRVLGASLGTRSYFEGPQAKQQRMAVATVALLLTAVSGWALFLWFALILIVLGSALTCCRRLSLISKELQSSQES